MKLNCRDIVGDITDNITFGAKVVVKTGKEMVKTKLLQRDKSSLEKERDEKLYELGLSFYEMMLRDSLNIEKLQGMCEEIITIDEDISGIVREKEEYSAPDADEAFNAADGLDEDEL